MKNKHRLCLLFAATILSGAAFVNADVEAACPNIIFILADDLSSHSIGAYGAERYQWGPKEKLALDAPVKTPNIDRMATGGMRFTNVLACPVCSPTRGMFLTGKYNHRLGLRDIVGRNGATDELDVTENTTLAQLLRDNGYVTAMAGKWHLSKRQNGFVDEGTQETKTAHVTAAGFVRQYQNVGAHMRRYWDPQTGEYTPDWMQDWALRFLDEQAEQKKPFFLYYAHPVPHTPLRATPLNPDGPEDSVENFPYIMEYFDRQLGQVVDKVKHLGMAEDTLIVFSGDNGTQGIRTVMSDGRAFGGGKFGFGQNARVPLIAYWPGTLKPGTVVTDLIDFTDFMPTFLDVVGLEAPAGLDGVSFAPRLFGKPGTPRDWIFSLWCDKYVVRGPRFALREDGTLYDLENATGSGTKIGDDNATKESKAARFELEAVIERLGL